LASPPVTSLVSRLTRASFSRSLKNKVRLVQIKLRLRLG
jgi:hypothetical protein